MLCPCGSSRLYQQCCEPLIHQKAIADNPQQLMRSRYTAFALGGCGQYLLDTWHPSERSSLSIDSLSQSPCQWLGLNVVRATQVHQQGLVEFKARYLEPGGNVVYIHHEVSVFACIQNQWFYVSGSVLDTVANQQ